MVRHLPTICLHKLHNILLTFEITDETVNDVVELIVYTYSNTPADGVCTDRPSDKLRNLVIAFAAENGKQLTKYPVFKQMLAVGGD